MNWWVVGIVASAVVPMSVAWRANRGWTIRHALAWSWFAWLAWLGFAVYPMQSTAFAAVTMIAAMGIAGFGARRPGLMVWNLIVASFVAVLWLGWAESLLDGSNLKLGPLRLGFVGGVIAAALTNYLLTPLCLGVVLVGIGTTITLLGLWNGNDQWSELSVAAIGLSAWCCLGMSMVLRLSAVTEPFDRHWRCFRNRYGAIWATRLAEQFNNAARHHGWPVQLHWSGLSRIEARHQDGLSRPEEQEYELALHSLMKRFRTHEGRPS